jgi:tetratricopeptide (TPR) repeat protein
LTDIIVSLDTNIGVEPALVYVRHYAETEPHWAIIGACLYLRKDDVQTAAAVIENVLYHKDKLTAQELDVAQEVAGRIYVTAQEYDKAVGIYEQVIQLHPDDLNANNNLASILSEWISPPDLIRARNFGEKAMQIMKSNNLEIPGVLDTQGYILGQTGHLDEAIGMLKRSLQLQETPGIWFHLGLMVMKKGSISEALAYFQKAKGMLADPKIGKEVSNMGLELKIDKAMDDARKTAQPAPTP